jgi:RimJ/RimL family protein N-acetyltransferase
MAMFAGHWALHGFGFFVVEDKASGALLGRVGVWKPEAWVGYELGWGLARHAWGRGYALEATRAAGDWALAHLPTDKIVSLIHTGNVRSQNLARRLGMQAGVETLHVGQPHAIWEISREDWAARSAPA